MRATLLLLLLTIAQATASGQAVPTNFYNPTWSPDGRTIVFEARREKEKSVIYAVSADGSNLRALTDLQSENYEPRFSPDGRLIVFSSDRNDRRLQVHVMNADGSGVRQVTNTPTGEYYTAFFSPDQSRFMLHGTPTTGALQLYTINVDGSDLRALTSNMRADPGGWSPDGKLLVFASKPTSSRDWMQLTPAERDSINRRGEVYVINADGSGLKQLTNNNYFDRSPRFSRDGRRVEYLSSRNGTELFVSIDLNGTNERQLGAVATMHSLEASPDGRFVVFTRYGVDAGVYVRDVQTGVERPIAKGDLPRRAGPSPNDEVTAIASEHGDSSDLPDRGSHWRYTHLRPDCATRLAGVDAALPGSCHRSFRRPAIQESARNAT